jgi:predicted ATPase/DNA-binding SARP family transcriptional activator
MSTELQLYFFGAPQILVGGNAITEQLTGKALALFVYLATTGRPHTRDRLADLLWSTLPPQQARNNLRYLLPSLRQSMGDYLIITPQTLAFKRHTTHWLDVAQLRAILTAKTESISTATLQATLDLYQEEFLAGFRVRNATAFDLWLTEQREELQALVILGLWLRIDRAAEEADQAAIQAALHRLHTLDPQWEEKWEARAHPPQARMLYPAEQPSPMAHQKHNLPRQLTKFVGRVEEVAAIRTKLLQPDCVWLTVVGEGGVGKTRLALAAATTLLAHFPDGVWFVPLLGLTPGPKLMEQMVNAIGEALQLSFTDHQPPLHQLVAHLQQKEAILILDSFEHLAESAEWIATLLQTTQRLKVLLTSRHCIGLQAEHLLWLKGLSVPSTEETKRVTTPQALLAYDSAVLFVERATHLMPTFCLRHNNWQEIAKICQLVGGLPLGLELAATRVNRQSCTELATAIAASYTVLEAGLRDLPERHQSIQGVLNDSWRFLSAAEARILVQCTVFSGTFTADAARCIVGASTTQLERCVSRSLLHDVQGASVSGQFVLHPLVRQYAQQQAAALDIDLIELRHRHATYYIEWLHLMDRPSALDGQAQATLHENLDNVRQAWQWTVEQLRVHDLMLILPPLYGFYARLGLLAEAAEAIDHACTHIMGGLEQSHDLSLQRALGYLFIYKAKIALALGQGTDAEQAVKAGIQVGEMLDDADIEDAAQRYYQEISRQ